MPQIFLKATHEGSLSFSSCTCANLDNGMRIISETGFLEAIGRSGKVPGGLPKVDTDKLPYFLSALDLKPFVDKHLTIPTNPVWYIPIGGGRAKGYSAELLPQVRKIYWDAQRSNALRKDQIHIADKCTEILFALAGVAIAALIDEATGYQYDRPKDTLQALMALYVNQNPDKWNLQFKESFYQEISRLRKWTYVPNHRSFAFAQVTVDLVYKRIQPGLWEELKKTNPNKKKYRYHQMLTHHIGNPHLREHLRAITKLMQGSSNWNQFMAMANRAYPLNNIQMDIFFDLLIESPEDSEKYKDLVS